MLSDKDPKCHICGRKRRGRDINLGFRTDKDINLPICFDCDFDKFFGRPISKNKLERIKQIRGFLT